MIGFVAADLRRRRVKETGRQGLPAEAVLRCGLLKQHRQLSYEELAFHLDDSASFRAFVWLPISWTPKKSVLQQTIGAIRTETWEAINRALLASARRQKLEDGSIVRLDSTVTSALLHEPTDSNLLWDAVRVMVRLLREADGLLGGVPRLARSPPRGKEASPRHPIYSRPPQTGPALSRVDQNHLRDLSQFASGGGTAGDDLRLGDAPLCEPVCDAADFLNGPADKRRVRRIWGLVCWVGVVLARWRIAAIMAKASMTSETWRCQPCQERVSL